MSSSGTALSGPPYQPQVAQLGGTPNNSVDTPICAVFIFLFLLAAIMHMTIFRRNLKQDHKFIFSALLFGLSMARTTALVLRIVWANRTTNVSIAIATSVFTNAGVIMLFVVNVLFAKRIIRGYHPHLGSMPAYNHIFSGFIGLIVAILSLLIGVTVASFYTLDTDKSLAFRDIQRFAAVFFAVLAFLPIPLVLAAMVVPSSSRQLQSGRPSKFGTGSWRTKLYLLFSTSVALTLGAAFRAGISFVPRAVSNPAWYHSKACFYCFIFLIEIYVSFTYGGMRFDRRFHTPVAPKNAAGDGGQERTGRQRSHSFAASLGSRINTEGAAFGVDSTDEGSENPAKAEQI